MSVEIPEGKHPMGEIDAATQSALSEISVPPATFVHAAPDDDQTHVEVGGDRPNDKAGTLGNTYEERVAIVRVIVRSKRTTGLHEHFYGIVREIEEGMLADSDLGGRLKGIEWQGTTITTSDELEKPGGKVVVEYLVLYAVNPSDMTEFLN